MRDIAEQNKILETVTGSHLYGTNTPQSDIDYVGIMIAPEKFYLGLQTIEEVDLSVVSKQENGKNDSEAIDKKYYELRKFMKLAMDNSPNILELLFTNKETYLSSAGYELLQNAHIFPWKGCAQKFLGYAFSQKHKMLIKTSNYTELNQFNDWLNVYTVEPIYTKGSSYFYTNQLLAELRNIKIPGVKFHEHHALVGDINISLTDKLSKVKNKVKDRLSKVGNREELYTKYGFDVKYGMHLIRLMLEGKELLQTGQIVFPLIEKDMLLDIRNGKWSAEEIIKYSEELEKEVESLKETTKLPSKPRFNDIENLLIRLVKNHHYNQR